MAFLAANPLGRSCEARGQLVVATVVDHIVPHRGDWSLFWNRRNWQPLCGGCHATAKQREERRGHGLGCDASGRPLDPAHHWHWPAGRGGSKG